MLQGLSGLFCIFKLDTENLLGDKMRTSQYGVLTEQASLLRLCLGSARLGNIPSQIFSGDCSVRCFLGRWPQEIKSYHSKRCSQLCHMVGHASARLHTQRLSTQLGVRVHLFVIFSSPEKQLEGRKSFGHPACSSAQIYGLSCSRDNPFCPSALS